MRIPFLFLLSFAKKKSLHSGSQIYIFTLIMKFGFRIEPQMHRTGIVRLLYTILTFHCSLSNCRDKFKVELHLKMTPDHRPKFP